MLLWATVDSLEGENEMKGQTTCRCGCGSDLTPDMKWVLNGLEKDMQADLGAEYQLNLTCGARCAKHNAEIGGVPNSAHILGRAADVGLTTSQERFSFLKNVLAKNIRRIEDRLLNHSYCHIDIGQAPDYPQNVFIALP